LHSDPFLKEVCKSGVSAKAGVSLHTEREYEGATLIPGKGISVHPPERGWSS
jgi:hypothetical protein